MDAIGIVPYRGETCDLSYQVAGQAFHNLIGCVPGESRELPPVLIGAHYDTCGPTPGADDNAAAVAIALAVAERLMESRPARDVVIALFDAEEPPHFHGPSMGSTRFFEDQRDARSFHAAVIMDLVGHDLPFPSPDFARLCPQFARLLVVTGVESHPALPGVVLASRSTSTPPLVATCNRRVGDMSDHHVFRLNGVPFLFLTCGRWEHYHRLSDTPDVLNYEKMEGIGQFLLRLAGALSGAELSRGGGGIPGFEGGRPNPVEHDTTALEIQLFREAFGPDEDNFLLRMLGLKGLHGPADLDALASGLQRYFEL